MPNLIAGAPGLQALEELIVTVDALLVPLGLTSSNTWATIKTALQTEESASGA